MKKWIVFSMGLLLFGCASTQELKILDKDLDRLQSRINILQKENKSTKNELSDLKAANQELTADLFLRLDNLQSEIQILSTTVEEYEQFFKRPSKEMESFKGDMDSRLRCLEETRKTQGGKVREIEYRFKGLDWKTPESTSKLMESERPAPTREDPPELRGVSGMGDLYKEAYETFYKGDLEEAREKFEAFLKQYPDAELSNNAQFWIGETYYQKKDFEKAILEYEKTIKQYPEGGKIPVALLKEALAFLELGDKENARRLLRGVIELYPNSYQAQIAKKKLEAIK
jgi:tol-pal system protein YbgF